MKNFYVMIMLFIAPVSLYGAELPDSLDDFTSSGLKGRFMGIHDPGYIRIKLETGAVIDTTYSGIDFDTLYEWEQNANKLGVYRVMTIRYSNAEGVMAEDLQSRRRFSLNGVIETHPISIAVDECERNNSTTMGIQHCKRLELEAWDAELNRAYKNLGGRSNEKLRAVQLAWIKYRDAQIEYLRAAYGKREGTIWRLVYMDHVVDITRKQAEQLNSINGW